MKKQNRPVATGRTARSYRTNLDNLGRTVKTNVIDVRHAEGNRYWIKLIEKEQSGKNSKFIPNRNMSRY